MQTSSTIPGGTLLRYMREAQGVTRNRLAVASGVSSAKIRAFELNEKRKLPSVEEAKRLFEALGELGD